LIVLEVVYVKLFHCYFKVTSRLVVKCAGADVDVRVRFSEEPGFEMLAKALYRPRNATELTFQLNSVHFSGSVHALSWLLLFGIVLCL